MALRRAPSRRWQLSSGGASPSYLGVQVRCRGPVPPDGARGRRGSGRAHAVLPRRAGRSRRHQLRAPRGGIAMAGHALRHAALGHRLRHHRPTKAPHGPEPGGCTHEVPHEQGLRERTCAPAGTPYPTPRALGHRFATLRYAALRHDSAPAGGGPGQPGDRGGGGARPLHHLAPVVRPQGPSAHALVPWRPAERLSPNKHSIYDTGLKVPAATPKGALQLFKGTIRNTYALHPEVSGRPTRTARNGLHTYFPPGHTPTWARWYAVQAPYSVQGRDPLRPRSS